MWSILNCSYPKKICSMNPIEIKPNIQENPNKNFRFIKDFEMNGFWTRMKRIIYFVIFWYFFFLGLNFKYYKFKIVIWDFFRILIKNSASSLTFFRLILFNFHIFSNVIWIYLLLLLQFYTLFVLCSFFSIENLYYMYVSYT